MSDKKISVLVVDDEKNIRLTLTQALDSPKLRIDTVVNGEEALQKIAMNDYQILLLDLKMPGMDGMEVLKRISESRPDIRVIIITAHGSIDSAVEAMKLGAVDFIQKPFAPNEIRSLVTSVIARETLSEEKANDYTSFLELAKRAISDRHFDTAKTLVGKAISIDNSRPEAMNLLGALHEIEKNILEAQKYYRVAIAIDSTYKPALDNLHRSTSWTREGQIIIDTGKNQEMGQNAEEK
ncbi:MAG: response regulator [Candidatus Latescibacteria bacterium]|nr:response regulator [Candidatus Latescibacterota bacterium]